MWNVKSRTVHKAEEQRLDYIQHVTSRIKFARTLMLAR